MRSRIATLALCCMICLSAGMVYAGDSEQDVVNRFLQKTEVPKKHSQHTGWFSVNGQYNRMSRGTDYNKFDAYLNTQLSGGQFVGQYNAKSIGADLGTMISKRVALSIGGEYWLKYSEKVSGTAQYTPAGGSPVTLTDPTSEVSVIGGFAAVQVYVMNAPSAQHFNKGISAWVGSTVGYYSVNWNVFQQYQNLNLSTSQPDGSNAAFTGSAPGFSLNAGVEYPIIPGLNMSASANYLYLNFSNVAWYNASNQEVVATYDGTQSGRVNLTFNGLRGQISLRKYFSW